MSQYDGLSATSQRLIASKGRDVTLRRKSAGTYSASSDSHSGASVVDRVVKAVFTKFTTLEIGNGEIIKHGDVKVLIAGYEPAKDDIIIDGADSFTLVNVDKIQPGDLALLYKAQARK